MTPSNLVIGVDAGGSKTTAWIAPLRASDGPRYLGQGDAGPGNPRAVGFDAAFREIKTAIDSAFHDAQLSPERVSAICLSAAGAGRKVEQQRLTLWAEGESLAERIVVTGDAEPVLAAVSPENVGIVLICGTGSFAWGRNGQGQTARVGGWGYLFGDEGSGYAIALAGLRAAAKAADGRGPPTSLLNEFLRRLHAAEPSELIERIYGGPLSRKKIAKLADLVFMAEEDDVARGILEQAEDELATMVTTLAAQLKLDAKPYEVAAAGGVFVHQPDFAGMLIERLGPSVKSISLVADPVAGAVALARRAAPRSS